MKRIRLIFIGLLAVLTAGCAYVGELTFNSGDDWVVDENILVPIQLGFGNITKITLGEENLEEQIFGLFAVDSNPESELSEHSLLLYNNPAILSESSFTFQDSSGNPVILYYPIDSEVEYLFYGYCVGESLGLYHSEVESAKIIVKDVPVTGHNDVLAGCTGVPVNGPIVRKDNIENVDFSFKHVTACLSFSAECAESGLYVESIAFEDMPIKADLCVLDKSIVNNWQSGSFEEDYVLEESVNIECDIDVQENLQTKLCDDIFLVPGSMPSAVIVNVTYSGKQYTFNIIDGIKDVNDLYGVTSYESGSRYRYKLNFDYSESDGLTIETVALKSL